MDPITAKLMSAAGAAADPVYVDDVFSTFLYEGNGTSQTINNGIDVSGEGALVWIRNRNASSGADHIFTDTERGTNTVLESNRTRAAQTKTDMITSFTSTGFAVADNGHVNENNDDICSWTFRKAPGFFDVVTYTGNGADRDITHNLGSEPGSIWIKRTDNSESWIVYHRNLHSGGGSGTTENFAKLELESTGGQFGGTRLWGSGTGEDHTAATFHVSGNGSVNTNGGTFVAYLFAHDDQSFGEDGDESIIKCGSYTGTGTGGGDPINTITLGFEPQWVLIKSTSASGNWLMLDTMRGFNTIGQNDNYLMADLNSQEYSHTYGGVTPTGFQLKEADHNANSSGVNYTYIAIRRPHKPPSAGTEVFKPELLTSYTQTSTPGFAPDLVLQRPVRSGSYSFFVGSRLTGNGKYLVTGAGSAEGSFTSWKFDAPTGKFTQTLTTGSTSGGIQHFFKRALGFFDVAAYTGTGSTKTESHNLGVAPEMMWVKRRSGSVNWAVYYGDNTDYLILNNDAASIDNNAFWNDTSPTASVFTVGSDNDVNRNNETYIAYLFATLPGISKVGSYTGTGSAQNIDCGFTNGARFVLIKGSSNPGNWTGFDTARGIASGNDPILIWNLDIAEITGYDRVDPLSSGFAIANTDQSDINASGRTYIFLAIA